MKYIFFLLVLIFLIPLISCDKDECPICHECECICPESNSKVDSLLNIQIDDNECPSCQGTEGTCLKKKKKDGPIVIQCMKKEFKSIDTLIPH